MPSTAEAIADLERRKAIPRKPGVLESVYEQDIAWAEKRLAECQQRDTLAATRPDSCWCLGLGGDVEYTTRLGDHYFDKTCTCPEGLVAEAHKLEVKRAEAEHREKQRVKTLWGNSQIPARFESWRLGTSPLAKTHPNLVVRLCPPSMDIVDDDTYGTLWDAWVGSWFFYGPSGVGKTGLAVSLAWERVENDVELESILFVTVPRLLSQLRSTYNRSQDNDAPTEQQVMEAYVQADLLILDDLGAEQIRNTGWVEDRLYQIIGERHDELRATIFTSNLNLEQLAARIGERITWRIVEMVGKNIVHLTGPNLRD